jgi:hypothetical protein
LQGGDVAYIELQTEKAVRRPTRFANKN